MIVRFGCVDVCCLLLNDVVVVVVVVGRVCGWHAVLVVI